MAAFSLLRTASDWIRSAALSLAALTVAGALALGCGGNVNAGPPGVHPTITVQWPARSRDATAPGSAMSFTVTVTGPGTGTRQITAVFNRGNNANGFAQTYTCPDTLVPGSYTVNLAFWPLENAQSNPLSTPVGVASGMATVGAGSPSLGSYLVVGDIASVAVLPGQTVPVGGTLALNAAAYNSLTPSPMDDLVVTPGSIFWNVVSSDGSMTLTRFGQVSATAAGSMTVTAVVDGVVSPPQTVASYVADPVSGCSNTTYQPNYAAEMETSANPLYAGKLRYWTGTLLTVSVTSNSSLTPTFQSMVNQAFSAWTAGTGGQVTFTLVSPSQSPDVTITFQPSATIASGEDGVVGATSIFTSSTNSSVLSHVDVAIAGDLSDNAQTLNTIAHELGHALGIGGHSNVNQDLMFPFLNDDYAPTSNDVNTLYTAYCGSFTPTSPLGRAPRPPRAARPIVIVDSAGSK